MRFDYTLQQDDRAQVGLIVLQADETVEDDFRTLLPASLNVLVNRVPSGLDVTPATLKETASHLTQAARLFPQGLSFDAVGFACTSASAQIGSEAVADTVRRGTETAHVSNPLSALITACKALNISRLALLSPYVESVSEQLRATLQSAGIATPVFGTFAEAEEARVARISADSIEHATRTLCQDAPVDGVFLSCTNLRTLSVLKSLGTDLQLPVLSSNLVLAWHLWHLAQPETAPQSPLDMTPHSL
ncbi:MAG: Asp/Glu racemase [Paracoccaceae bacterium]